VARPLYLFIYMLVITQEKMDDKILMCLLRVVTFSQILVRSDSNDNVGEHDVVEWNEYDDVDAVIDGVDKYDGDGDGYGVGRVRVGHLRLYYDPNPYKCIRYPDRDVVYGGSGCVELDRRYRAGCYVYLRCVQEC